MPEQSAQYLNSADVYKTRSFAENLFYMTGSGYLTGIAVGGTFGFLEGIKRASQLPNRKLQFNAILNATGKRGPQLGNNLGVLGASVLPSTLFNKSSSCRVDHVAMMYCTSERLLRGYRDRNDDLNAVGAAAITGALFSSTCPSPPPWTD